MAFPVISLHCLIPWWKQEWPVFAACTMNGLYVCSLHGVGDADRDMLKRSTMFSPGMARMV
eukprot:547410-Pelagomonas_calceolata.AAC.1